MFLSFFYILVFLLIDVLWVFCAYSVFFNIWTFLSHIQNKNIYFIVTLISIILLLCYIWYIKLSLNVAIFGNFFFEFLLHKINFNYCFVLIKTFVVLNKFLWLKIIGTFLFIFLKNCPVEEYQKIK